MSALFSKSCIYAVQATLYVSLRDSSSPVLLRDISEALGIPQPFLSKILQRLVHAGVLSSHRGANGGFTLAKEPQSIHLQDIAESIGDTAPEVECLLGFRWCTHGEPCVVHSDGTTVKDLVRSLLTTRTIASLSKEIALHHVSSQYSGHDHDTTSASAH